MMHSRPRDHLKPFYEVGDDVGDVGEDGVVVDVDVVVVVLWVVKVLRAYPDPFEK